MYNFLVGLMLAVFILSGCTAKKPETKIEDSLPVKVIKVELESLYETLEYVGNIRAYDEALIYPKASGKVMEKIKEEGAKVNKGDAVVYLDRDEVGLKFEKAPVESPLSGIIGKVYVDMGENVSLQTPVALVLSMDKVKIDLDIPEKYLPQVELAQSARISVDAYPKQEFKGSVTQISPLVDINTRTAPIQITIDNPEHLLKSGMFAKVTLILKEIKDVPVILKEALLGNDSNQYVYIIENNKAQLRKVSLGIRQGPYWEIKEGLKEGDLVVILGQQRLYEGANVIIEEYQQ